MEVPCCFRERIMEFPLSFTWGGGFPWCCRVVPKKLLCSQGFFHQTSVENLWNSMESSVETQETFIEVPEAS